MIETTALISLFSERSGYEEDVSSTLNAMSLCSLDGFFFFYKMQSRKVRKGCVRKEFQSKGNEITEQPLC